MSEANSALRELELWYEHGPEWRAKLASYDESFRSRRAPRPARRARPNGVLHGDRLLSVLRGSEPCLHVLGGLSERGLGPRVGV